MNQDLSRRCVKNTLFTLAVYQVSIQYIYYIICTMCMEELCVLKTNGRTEKLCSFSSQNVWKYMHIVGACIRVCTLFMIVCCWLSESYIAEALQLLLCYASNMKMRKSMYRLLSMKNPFVVSHAYPHMHANWNWN